MGQTALLVNQQPGGLALLGAPVPFTTGNVYWVSSVTAALRVCVLNGIRVTVMPLYSRGR